MSRWPKDNQADLLAFYGAPGAAVESQLVDVVPPFRMTYEGKPIKAIKFHKKAAPALLAALTEIWEHYGKDQATIDRLGLSRYDGAYNPRFIRGSSSKWSNHAYGAAIDINAQENGFNTGHGTMPQPAVDAFKRQGARWGGNYHGRTDPMHFEFCDNGEGVASTPQKPIVSISRYHSLVPGGFFANPDISAYNWSIRSNNVGAINGATKDGHPVKWVQDFPGFVKTVVIGGGNPIAIMETPEQGVALWWTLLKRYRDRSIWNPPVSTVQGIVNRYGGGQDYSAYVKFVCDRTKFAPSKMVDLNDDATLLALCRAMGRYEAGVESPLTDEQFRYGFRLARGPVTITQDTKDKRGPSVSVAVGGGGVAALLFGGMGAHWIIIVGIALAVSFGLWLWLRK